VPRSTGFANGSRTSTHPSQPFDVQVGPRVTFSEALTAGTTVVVDNGIPGVYDPTTSVGDSHRGVGLVVLTGRELDVMNVLWDLGSATVAEVLEGIPDDLAYNTVLTILRRLEKKGHP